MKFLWAVAAGRKLLFEPCLSGCHRHPLDVVFRDFVE